MRRIILLGVIAAALTGCCSKTGNVTGTSVPDLGWLFTDNGPYVLNTKVQAAPGSASLALIKDISLMADKQDTVLFIQAEVAPDSILKANLGKLEPGFYQLRLRDSVRWNIGIKPDAVISEPDAPEDFDEFWKNTLNELDQIPLEAEFKEIPEYSNDKRTCYEVTFPSFEGGVAGGILSVPTAPGKYPVYIQYMGYGAPVFYFDPSANPERIDFLVSVRDQGIFKGDQSRWIDRGIDSRDNFYYRGAFCDVKRAIDFAASLEKANPDRMVAFGESQGGAFTFMAAALDPRIRAIAPAVPFLGDYADYARIVSWPVHEVFEEADTQSIPREQLLDMLRYFDVKNFAPKIECPVYMSFGLQDPTCPPHTNFAIYNNLSSHDKRFLCVPTCGHAMWLEPYWAQERDMFLDSYTKPEND